MVKFLNIFTVLVRKFEYILKMHCPIKIESQLFNFQIITFKRENTALDLALYQERNEVASILLQVNMPLLQLSFCYNSYCYALPL